MIVYRITTEKYSKKLSASGAANRWNEEGQFVIYTAFSRSLASLEMVVHRASIRPRINYKVVVINIDVQKSQIKKIDEEQLPESWRSVAAYSALQSIGSQWYIQNKKLVLEIPSAVVPQESNYIINTKHEMFDSKVRVVSVEDFFWDRRLL